MNPYSLSSSPLPSSHQPSLLLHSPFLNPIPLRNSTVPSVRRRPRLSSARNSAADQPSPPPPVPVKELSGLQPLVSTLSPPLRLASSALIIAGALSAGYALGSRLGGTRNAALGGAAVLGAAGGAAVYALNACVPEVAAVSLHNYVAACDDPTALSKRDIEAIANKFGVSKHDETFNAELCDIYCRFVSSVLPHPEEDLKGTEVDTIVKFKIALGIDDPDAAAMHMEIGRRIFRQRLETGDRDGDVHQRRAFQKLMYVSTLVFGEAAPFLLPWKRIFKVSDAQVEVAIRDNAQRLYSLKLKSVGRDMDVEQLVSLREAQLSYRLSDEIAEDMFREHMRKLVDENISGALNALKSMTKANRGTSKVVEELNKVVALNDLLSTFKDHPDAIHFARGLGPISIVGGEYDSERKMDELKLLYKLYATDSLSSGRMEDTKVNKCWVGAILVPALDTVYLFTDTDEKVLKDIIPIHPVASLSKLRNILGLGNREAESIMVDVTSKVYQSRLAQAFSGGDLEASESKAAFLQNLCEQLRFDPEKASGIHKDIYRQKLQQCLADGDLSEEDVAALLRVRVMLCIPQQTVETAHAEICGRLFEKVVGDAIVAAVGPGVDGYDIEKRKSVRKAAQGLRLTSEVAMSTASKIVRKMFLTFINRSRTSKKRSAAAKELKDMINFNKSVVTKLIEDIKGEPMGTFENEDIEEEEEKESVKEETYEDEAEKQWESLQTLKKTKAKELAKKMGKPGQSEITLKNKLSAREKGDIYKSFLNHCLSGNDIATSFGAKVTTQSDSEFPWLHELGVILGMSSKEIVDVHRSVAEQAFRKKAEVILADGQLTKEKLKLLEDEQREIGMPPEYAQKVIKNITTTMMSSAIGNAMDQGKLNIKQIRELKGSGVPIENLLSESSRESIFRKTVDEIFSSGTGEFDKEEVYDKIPSDLNINAEKASRYIHEVAHTRASNSLIQAVSFFRQKNKQGVIASLNDLVACDKAVTCKPLTWEFPEELGNIFGIYMKSEQAPEKVSRMQYLLGVSDTTRADLQETGGDVLEDVEAEEKFVF